MSTAKHTPAPWSDGREGSGDFISPDVVVLGDTGECGKCGGGPGEIFIKPADKKLIKAAPDLAAALEALLAEFTPKFPQYEGSPGVLAANAARAALRKAGRLP